MSEFMHQETFCSLGCEHCAATWYVPAQWFRFKALRGEEIFCPLGHANVYSDESEADKLARADRLAEENRQLKGQLARALQKLDQLEAARSRRQRQK